MNVEIYPPPAKFFFCRFSGTPHPGVGHTGDLLSVGGSLVVGISRSFEDGDFVISPGKRQDIEENHRDIQANILSMSGRPFMGRFHFTLENPKFTNQWKGMTEPCGCGLKMVKGGSEQKNGYHFTLHILDLSIHFRYVKTQGKTRYFAR